MVSVYLFRDLLVLSFVLIMEFLLKVCSRAVNLSCFSFMCVLCLASANLLIVKFFLFLFRVIVSSEFSGLMIPSSGVLIGLLLVRLRMMLSNRFLFALRRVMMRLL
jgi:hypothetical protein